MKIAFYLAFLGKKKISYHMFNFSLEDTNGVNFDVLN